MENSCWLKGDKIVITLTTANHDCVQTHSAACSSCHYWRMPWFIMGNNCSLLWITACVSNDNCCKPQNAYKKVFCHLSKASLFIFRFSNKQMHVVLCSQKDGRIKSWAMPSLLFFLPWWRRAAKQWEQQHLHHVHFFCHCVELIHVYQTFLKLVGQIANDVFQPKEMNSSLFLFTTEGRNNENSLHRILHGF